MNRSEVLFEQAKKVIPGGVNSPVRAFLSVNDTPRFIKEAQGAVITDVDGNSYIDYVGSWGPMILGHNHPAIMESVLEAIQRGISFGAATENEVKMADLICSLFPSVELVRMVNSGTEAVMSAIRLARGATGRDKILKFEGCYHGHCDSMLVSAGSGLMTRGVSSSAGITEGCAKDTISVAFNDIEAAERVFEMNKNQIAAVILEPVAANMGVVLPKNNFLGKLKKLCEQNDTLLIFDEVITGFRLGIGGAQERYGIRPDLTVFGKIIGGGMPVGAYGGRRDLMEHVAPLGNVYQAGTLSGNPIATAAGIAQLSYLKNHPEVYEHLDALAEKLFQGLKEIVARTNASCTVNHVGALGCLFFTSHEVENYEDANKADVKGFADYFGHMLSCGIYLAPSQFEAMFLSNAHRVDQIETTLNAAEDYFAGKNRRKQ
jgi:glutamate-1-semialdehyde 2,1-aminomutase